MRQYLGFRCQQASRPQSAGVFSSNDCELTKFEDVVMVMGYTGTAARLATQGLEHGPDSDNLTNLIQFNTGSDKTIDGGDCTKAGDGQLRVLYGNARLSSAYLTSSGRLTSVGGDTTARYGALFLGFLPDTYDETNPESVSWAVPEQGVTFTSVVGEVARID